jgi:hypothetical protein
MMAAVLAIAARSPALYAEVFANQRDPAAIDRLRDMLGIDDGRPA